MSSTPPRDGLRVFTEAVAIVTGGGSGIGAALGRGLAERGAYVVIADRDECAARTVSSQIVSGGARAEAVRLDVRDATAVERVVADAYETHGRLDFLFNNAGVVVGGWTEELSLDDWRYAIDVNLMGPVHGIQAAYPRMVEQGFGHVVNTASMVAFMAAALTAPYGATKSAVLGLSRALRAEAATHGVRVSVVCPGIVRTPILPGGGKFGRTPLTDRDAPTMTAFWERLRPMSPDVFAAKALDAVARNKAQIILPAWWRAVRLMNGLFPSLVQAEARREMHRVGAMLRKPSNRA
jgi:NAD(P)-dependent dehydrogenase (short-subunit alcohol dehydrogenase family)